MIHFDDSKGQDTSEELFDVTSMKIREMEGFARKSRAKSAPDIDGSSVSTMKYASVFFDLSESLFSSKIKIQ